MTVKELMAELGKLPKDAHVEVAYISCDGNCSVNMLCHDPRVVLGKADGAVAILGCGQDLLRQFSEVFYEPLQGQSKRRAEK